MTKEEIEELDFDKSKFLQKKENPIQIEDLDQKRQDLKEEYKVLQSKLDQYGTSSIQGNGIIISLFSAILAFAIQKDYQAFRYISIILASLSVYFFYFQVMNQQAKNMFQKRIGEIELALNANPVFLSKIKLFSIAENSQKISIMYVIKDFYTDLYASFFSIKKLFRFLKNSIYWKLLAIPVSAFFFFNLNINSFIKKNESESDQNKTVHIQINVQNCNNEKSKIKVETNKSNTNIHYVKNINADKNNYTMNNKMNKTSIELNNSNQEIEQNQKIDIEEINNFIHLQNNFLNKLGHCYDCNISSKKEE